MAFGVDYSFDRPDPDALRRHQPPVEFACRYLRGSGKALSLAEAKRLAAAGISVVSNDETTGSFMLGGRTAGVSAANAAWAAHKACGGPDHRPIYFSLDVDWRSLSAGEHDAVLAFLDGAASVIGRDQVGVYGGYYTIDAVADSGKATWFWQTRAWSDGKVHSRTHIHQYEVDTPSNPVRLAGAAVDFNRSLKTDYGQWKVGQAVAPQGLALEAGGLSMADAASLETQLKSLAQQVTKLTADVGKVYHLLEYGEKPGHVGDHHPLNLETIITELRALQKDVTILRTRADA